MDTNSRCPPCTPCCPPSPAAYLRYRLYNNSDSIYFKLATRLETTFDNYLAAHVINLGAEATPVGTPAPPM